LKWVTKKSIEKTIEVTGMELTCKKKKIIIIALYRPASGGIHELFTQLTYILEKLAQNDQYIILVGDLNINTQQGGSSHKQLLHVTKAYNLAVTINIPTRVTECMATTIDQIITNMPAKCYYTEVINSLLSDHYCQCITINIKAQQQTRCYKEVRNVSKANIIGLCSSIQNETWIEVSRENDIEKKWDSIYSIFNYSFNIACPKVRRNNVSIVSPWINKDAVIARAKLKDL
jgi:exonuclease III